MYKARDGGATAVDDGYKAYYILPSRRVRHISNQKEKQIGELFHFCTRANDNKSQI
jgi:hypothetical protein